MQLRTLLKRKERGLTDSQAIIWGLASGAVEGITEKYSIDTILNNPKTVLSKIIKNPIARSFAAEGSEEIAANILDRIADEIIAVISRNFDYSINLILTKECQKTKPLIS